MSPTARASREVPAEEPVKSLEFFEKMVTLYKDGVECMAEIQNRTIDCAVQHNKATMELWKQMTDKLPWAPRVNVFESLAGTLDRFAEAQKAAIKLGVDQTRLFVDIVKERTASVSKTADTLSKFAQQGFEQSLAAHKKVAEATVAETKSAFDTARERFTVPGSEAVVESIRQGVDTVINAQKDLLESAASGWSQATETVAAA